MNNRIVSIQLMRALACLLVLVVHLNTFNPLTANQLSGSIGVDIFFVISGFIIAASVERLPAERAIQTFALNRFSRVVPYYYLMTLFFVTVNYFANKVIPSLADIGKSFLFLPMGNGHDPVHPVGWTLNHEIFFYVFVSITLLISRNIKHIAALFFVLLVFIQIVPSRMSTIIEIQASINYEFLYGIFIYLMRDKFLPQFRSILWMCLAFVLLIVVMRISIEVPLTDEMKAIAPMGKYYRDTIFLYRFPITLPRGLFWGLPSAFLFISVLAQEFRINKMNDKNFVLKIGDASFTLYLLQHAFFALLSMLAISNLFILAVFFCLIIIASIHIYTIESQIARLVKRMLKALISHIAPHTG